MSLLPPPPPSASGADLGEGRGTSPGSCPMPPLPRHPGSEGRVSSSSLPSAPTHIPSRCLLCSHVRRTHAQGHGPCGPQGPPIPRELAEPASWGQPPPSQVQSRRHPQAPASHLSVSQPTCLGSGWARCRGESTCGCQQRTPHRRPQGPRQQQRALPSPPTVPSSQTPGLPGCLSMGSLAWALQFA